MYTKRLLFYPVLMLLACLVIGEFALVSFQSAEKQKQKSSYDALTNSISQTIQREIVVGTSSTSMLEAFLRLNDFDTSDFDNWGKEVLFINQSVSAVQLAPGGVVTHAYPLEGHEKAIGHDLLADPRRRSGAEKAIDSKALTFVGPVRLVQNGRLAVIARKPVYHIVDGKNIFWGFTIALIYVEDIMANALKGLKSSSLRYQLLGSSFDSASTDVLASSEQKVSNDAVTYPVLVPNGAWNLSVEYLNENQMGDWIFHGFIFFISCLLAYFVFSYERNSQAHQTELSCLNKKLEEMAYFDPLTGLRNRRALLDLARELFYIGRRKDVPLCIAYLDIDHFKEINDKFGHDVGDTILKAVSKTLSDNCRESDVIARWGGEEFIIILPYTDLVSGTKVAENLLKLMSTTKFEEKSVSVALTVSIGLTAISADDSNIEDAIKRADTALYTAKNNGRNRCEINSATT